MWLKIAETIVLWFALLYTIQEIRNTVVFVVNALLKEYAKLDVVNSIRVAILWTIFYALRS